MLMKSALMALVGLTVLAEAGAIPDRSIDGFRLARRQNFGKGKNAGKNNNAGNNNNNAGGNAGGNQAASETCLAANAVQTGSAQTGQNGAAAADGQVNSKTDNANFINICSGKTLTNGLQNRDGSCNGVPMGEIPATNRMVSTVITNPQHNDNIPAGQTFNVNVNIANMQLGAFTNATSTYYSAPQELSGGGTIIGHTHVTIQDVGNSLNPNQPLDASQFTFFKGINDAGNGNGQLTAVVTGGLPEGNYRVCTMAGASNHQPVLMPVAQRGAQDDCKYFTVSAGGANNAGKNNNNAGNNAAGGAADAGKNNNNAGNNAAGNGADAAAGKNNAGKNANAGNAGKATGNGKATASASTTAAADAAATATAGANAGKNNNGGKNNAGAGANAGKNNAGANAGKNNAGKNAGKGGNNNGKATNAGRDASSAGAVAATAGALGGAAPAVTDSGDAARPFSVNGNTFVNRDAAVQRACAIQNNACADAVNGGQLAGSTIADCNAQEAACRAAA